MKPHILKNLKILLSVLFITIFQLVSYGQNYTFVGDAQSYGVDCYEITSDAGNKIGAVWHNDQIDLNHPFDIQVKLYFGANDGGADEMVFVLQTAGPNAIDNIPTGATHLAFEESVEPPMGWTVELKDNQIL